MKGYTYKKENFKTDEVKDNPFDLLNFVDLVNREGKIQDFYEIDVSNNKVIKNLTLADFVAAGVKIIQKESKGENNDNGGYSAQIGSSGDFARIGSSGDFAQIGSSGDSARIGSSGDSARIGSSGDFAKIGSSGYSDRIGSSGDSARIGSSGDFAQINVSGEKSIAFSCGIYSIISGKKGTWISLAEFKQDNKGYYYPIFAKSAQIGNKKYLDYKGNVLKEDVSYQLVNKKFTPVIDIDGYRMVILSTRKSGEYEIIKTQYLQDFIDKKEKIQFVAKRGEITAHGATVKQAISDIEFKYMQSLDVSEHVKRVKEQGYITANDYRLLTGACQYGTNRWLEENGLTWEDKKPIDEVLKLTKGQYGHDRLKELLK